MSFYLVLRGVYPTLSFTLCVTTASYPSSTASFRFHLASHLLSLFFDLSLSALLFVVSGICIADLELLEARKQAIAEKIKKIEELQYVDKVDLTCFFIRSCSLFDSDFLC